MEEFDLNIKDLDEPISINVGNDAYSNSNPGIEFLMNDKKKSVGSSDVGEKGGGEFLYCRENRPSVSTRKKTTEQQMFHWMKSTI